MASMFLSMGLTPSPVTQKPKYSISACPKNDFSILNLSPFPFSLLSVNYSFFTWSVQYTLVKIYRSSMYARINPNQWNKSFIFCWRMSGDFATPIDIRLYQYFPQGKINIHKLLAFLLSRIWYYPIFKSSNVAYRKTSNFNNMSFILGIGYGYCFNCLFKFLKSIRKLTRLDLGLGRAKYGAPHSVSFATFSTPSINKCSASFKNKFLVYLQYWVWSLEDWLRILF